MFRYDSFLLISTKKKKRNAYVDKHFTDSGLNDDALRNARIGASKPKDGRRLAFAGSSKDFRVAS